MCGHRYPCFELVMTSVLDSKARVNPSHACFLTCMQEIPRIHLWYNTCSPLDGQLGSRGLFGPRYCTCVKVPISLFQMQNHILFYIDCFQNLGRINDKFQLFPSESCNLEVSNLLGRRQVPYFLKTPAGK